MQEGDRHTDFSVQRAIIPHREGDVTCLIVVCSIYVCRTCLDAWLKNRPPAGFFVLSANVCVCILSSSRLGGSDEAHLHTI